MSETEQDLFVCTSEITTKEQLLGQMQEVFGFNLEGISLKEKWFLLESMTDFLTKMSPGGIREGMSTLATRLSTELVTKDQEEIIAMLVSQIRDM